MNEAALCLNQSSYHAGEIVYGAAYICICRPSQIRTLQIRIQGTETVTWSRRKGQSSSACLIDQSYDLLSLPQPIPFGSYLIPFKLPLPNLLPASFYFAEFDELCCEASDLPEACRVAYSISLASPQSQRFGARLDLLVEEEAPGSEEPLSVKDSLNLSVIPAMRKTLRLWLSLDRQAVRFGEFLTVTLRLENKTGRTIENVAIKLLRRISVACVDTGDQQLQQPHDPAKCPHCVSVCSTWWAMLMPGSDPEVMECGFDDLKIPIPSPTPCDFAQTVNSHRLTCQHFLQLLVSLDGGRRLQTEVRLPLVRAQAAAQSATWHQAEQPLPHWLASCSALLSRSASLPLRLDEALGTNFAAMPVLRSLPASALVTDFA